jgi:hypothetical protein
MTNSLLKATLPIYSIAQLYKHALITQNTNTTKAAANKATIKHLGNAEKGIVFIVHNPNAAIIENDVLDLLVAMLTKLQLNLQHIAIVNSANEEISYQQIQQQFEAQKIILLGVNTETIGLPLVFPMYKIQVHGTCSYLCSAALESLKGTNPTIIEEKKIMWNSIKQLLS